MLIITEHLTNIRFIKTHHGIKTRIYRDIPVYIISTRQIIQRHRAYPHHEYTVKHSLELFEILPVETTGVSQVMKHSLPMLTQYHIGKVVVLIYNEIQGISLFLRFYLYVSQLRLRAFYMLDGLLKISVIISCVHMRELIND